MTIIQGICFILAQPLREEVKKVISVLVCETERLRLSHFTLEDAGFVLRLLNDPAFIMSSADKGVRTLEQARSYLLNGPLTCYDLYGFGLSKVALKASGEPVGMCGLLKRDALEQMDIGYAFLPRYRAQGYAREAAEAILDAARQHHGLKRVLAVTRPDNQNSIRLLERIGFRYLRMIRLESREPEIKLFAREL